MGRVGEEKKVDCDFPALALRAEERGGEGRRGERGAEQKV